MAQIHLQQWDRDLLEPDDVLTSDKVDSLWEWFRTASQDKLPPSMIFAKLVNATRRPYRDNHLLERSGGLFTPATTHYTPSECTITPGIEHGSEQQQQQQRSDEGTSTIEALNTKLAVAQDLLQTKQTIISQLEDSLHTKQSIINQLEDSVRAKQTTINQLADSLQMKQTLIHQLEDSLRAKQATIHQPDDILQAKGTSALTVEEYLKKLVMEQYENQVKGQSERHLSTPRPEYYRESNMRLPHMILEAPALRRYFGISREGTAVLTSFSLSLPFTLLRHTNGMVSFQADTSPMTYLSAEASDVEIGNNNAGGTVTLTERCDSTEMFLLHETEFESVSIELVDFPGRFLWFNENYELFVRGTSKYQTRMYHSDGGIEVEECDQGWHFTQIYQVTVSSAMP
ncbi:hypothetical protein BDZ91DRAFT_745089 [Kalaharituber pfeilii]|nr:hypothetical protein BDZ91DRAFT_745089 [Kalaharituber pfeilii]